MFQTGDTIVYGNSGVCRITDIREETFGPVRRTYYVLSPVYDGNSTIYCPVDQQKIPLRPLLTDEEIHGLIREMPAADDTWIDDDLQRRERFADMLKSGDRAQMVSLIKTLYLHRREKSEAGKKLHLADERVMRDAERLLYEEFGHVLGIRPTDVVDYIRDQLQSEE